QTEQLQRDRVQPIGGNDVALKRRPAAAVRVTGHRIVDDLKGAVGIPRVAEIARVQRRVRHVEKIEETAILPVSLERPEEEQTVPPDRSAERATVDVAADGQLRWFSLWVVPEEVRRRVQLVAVVELERRALELVRSRFGDDGDGRAARHSLFR